MAQILVSNMSYFYTDYYHPIFDNVSFMLDTDWKTGLIGRNGSGKTTLLKLIYGLIKPYTGNINMPFESDYFPYETTSNYENVMDVIKENMGGLRTIEKTMEDIILSNCEERFDEYNILLDKYLQLNGFEAEANIQKEFELMKLNKSLLKRNFQTLSGGEKTAIQLISLFLKPNHFILLDEPTNHLDADRKEMIIKYLKKKKGFIIVSHDRCILDEVVDHIIAINKTNITIESGNYSTWKQNKDWKEQYEFQSKRKLENDIKQLELRIDHTNNWVEVANKQKYHFKCDARTNGTKNYQKQIKRSRDNILRNIEAKKTLLCNYEERKDLEIDGGDYDNEIILIVNNLDFSYPDSKKRIINNMSFILKNGERLWIKGKNGTGKTTLLKLLSSDYRSDAIKYADELEIVKVDQEPVWKNGMIKELFSQLKENNNDRFEKFQHICKCFDMPNDYLCRPIETLSFGERKKIDIARALSQKMNLLILDEPLNYMDVFFREQLEDALLMCDTTLIFVEHDEHFGENIATRIINMADYA